MKYSNTYLQNFLFSLDLSWHIYKVFYDQKTSTYLKNKRKRELDIMINKSELLLLAIWEISHEN